VEGNGTNQQRNSQQSNLFARGTPTVNAAVAANAGGDQLLRHGSASVRMGRRGQWIGGPGSPRGGKREETGGNVHPVEDVISPLCHPLVFPPLLYGEKGAWPPSTRHRSPTPPPRTGPPSAPGGPVSRGGGSRQRPGRGRFRSFDPLTLTCGHSAVGFDPG